MSAVQGPPPVPAALSDFPEATVPAGQIMFRAHNAAKGGCWFDNGSAGRFNLHGARGTWCTATSIDTAVRERVREHISQTGVVDPVFASEFVVSRVTAPLPYRCAAVSDAAAARYGVVRELVTMHDYTLPQAWAGAFDAAGFEGVFYGSAFTTGPASAYALFGDAGAPEAAAGFTEEVHMSGAEACTQLGWKVGPPPSSRDITVLN